jgi:hypothetical protein
MPDDDIMCGLMRWWDGKYVQIGAANTASIDFDQHIIGAMGVGERSVFEFELPLPLKYRYVHKIHH